MRKIKIDFTGTMPLLMHASNVLAEDEVRDFRKDPDNKGAKGDDRHPAWTWQTYLYSDGEHIVIPADNICKSLMGAGAQYKIPGSKKTFKALSQSGIIPDTPTFKLLIKGKPVPMADIEQHRDQPFPQQLELARALGFDLDVRRLKVGTSKHVRVRPLFSAGWTCSGSFSIIDDALDDAMLNSLFSMAGQRYGIGDSRPGGPTPGQYGTYQAVISAAKKSSAKSSEFAVA